MVTGQIGPAGQDVQNLVVLVENTDNELALIPHPRREELTVMGTSSRKMYATLIYAPVIIKIVLVFHLTYSLSLISNCKNDILNSTGPTEPDWCDSVDCNTPDAIESCPISCSSDPDWCRMADCSTPRALKSCKKTCTKILTSTETSITTENGNR